MTYKKSRNKVKIPDKNKGTFNSCPAKKLNKTSIAKDHKNTPRNTLALLFLLLKVIYINPSINAVEIEKISNISIREISNIILLFLAITNHDAVFCNER